MRRTTEARILAVHIFHGQKEVPIGFADIENTADVGMRNLARGMYFGMKARERRCVLRKSYGQKLDGDDLTQLQILGAIHFAHLATVRECHDAVTLRDDLPRCKSPAANDGVGTRRWIVGRRQARRSA
jgi:hypothetical protein